MIEFCNEPTDKPNVRVVGRFKDSNGYRAQIVVHHDRYLCVRCTLGNLPPRIDRATAAQLAGVLMRFAETGAVIATDPPR